MRQIARTLGMIIVLLFLAAGVGTVSALVIACEPAGGTYGEFFYEYPLIAGQSIPVGNVTVWDDGCRLYVKYSTGGGWYITEASLAVANDTSGIPQSKGGPVPGKFPYKIATNPTTEVTFDPIPLRYLQPNDGTLTIVAHAVVKNGRVQETAWGDESCELTRTLGEGGPFPGGKWATYFQYTLQAHPNPVPCD